MRNFAPHENVYPAAKVLAVVELLVEEGVDPRAALESTSLDWVELMRPMVRVSLNQVILSYRNALRLTKNRRLAFEAGQTFRPSSFGMYGFAMLSSADLRKSMRFCEEYHALETPLIELSFRERSHTATWEIRPVVSARSEPDLYRFLVEMQCGAHATLMHDLIAPAARAIELHVAYAPPEDPTAYSAMLGVRIRYHQPINRFIFDSRWLDRANMLGRRSSLAERIEKVTKHANGLELHAGWTRRVREMLMHSLAVPPTFEEVAEHLFMTTRTLRRKLADEGTSFRQIFAETRQYVAHRYLTGLSIEDIAEVIGFSESSNFRHAFKRWTGMTPQEAREDARIQSRRSRRITSA
ncbi:MAG: AraC family transcriptional regulator [Burkholderiaceae bacterium]